jgi:hypothetical protein
VSTQSPGPVRRATVPGVVPDPSTGVLYVAPVGDPTWVVWSPGDAWVGPAPLRGPSSVDAAIPTVLTPELPAEARAC